MTPLYDVLSAQAAVSHGQIRRNRLRLAMAVDRHYRINEVVPRHFLQAAKAAGFGVALAEKILAEVSVQIEPALERTWERLPSEFPMDLGHIIADGIRRRAASFM